MWRGTSELVEGDVGAVEGDVERESEQRCGAGSGDRRHAGGGGDDR
jgi:hypothetical protein